MWTEIFIPCYTAPLAEGEVREMEWEPYLRDSILFRELAGYQFAALRPFVRGVRWQPQQLIFRQGDQARHLYVLIDGSVELTYFYDGGPGFRGLSTVAVLEPSDTFGWSALVEPCVYTLTATAPRASQGCAIDGAQLRHVLRNRPDIAVRVYRGLTHLLASRLEKMWGALVAERGLIGLWR
jgi:CRP-like cAMP-binding protein